MARKKKKANKWKGKKWYTVKAPEMFENKEIADTPAEDGESIKGRTIKTSLNDITGKRHHRNTKVIFEINKVEGKKAKTEIKGFELTRSYIRKNIRKRRSVVKTVKDLTTDKGKLHTTAYAFTVRKLHSSQEKEIRRVIEEKLEEEAEENNFESLIQKMIFGNTAKAIFQEAKDIAPIKRIEITKCIVER